MKKLLLSMLGVLLSLPGVARIFTYTYEGQTLTYTVLDEDAKTCTIVYPTLHDKISGPLIIPNIAKNYDNTEYTVTTFTTYAFAGCSGLTSVVIPNSVTSIGESVFAGCKGLTSVEIPNSVTSIGWNAFSDCSSLTSVEIPNSVTSIGRSAFQDCSGLTSAKIGNSVTSIGWYAFEGCSGLTSIEIGNSVTSIGMSAFQDCSSLTSIEIGNSVTSIGERAFYNNSHLASVIIPNSVTSIGQGAFENCNHLIKSAYPDYLENPFEAYVWVTIAYPAKDAIIENGFVYGPEKSTIYFAPLSVSGEYSIPNSVTSIGDKAFSLCTGLKTLTVEPSTKTLNFGAEALYSVPIETLNIGRNWRYSKNEAISTQIKFVNIGDQVTTIPNNAFSNNTNLKEVEIPNSVTSIGSSAFSSCSGLTSVIIPNSVTNIGAWAFSDCSGLTSIEIPNSITNIECEVFKGCTNLSSAKIPNSVKSIGEGAFKNCAGLTSMEIPNSVTYINDNAFNGCTGLTSVVIPNSVSHIDLDAFSGCSGLKKSAYPDYLRDPFNNGVSIFYPAKGAIIENGFVYGPEKSAIYFAPLSLEGDYSIPSSVITIGNSAFCLCSGLKSLTIPSSVKYINNSAFNGCSGLTSVVIPNSVTHIGNRAFKDCTGLTSVVIPNSASTGDQAFNGCSNLKKSAYPDNYTRNPFNTGVTIAYPAEGSIIENGFVYGPEKSAIYFAPLTLEGDYTIPNITTTVGDNAFYGCTGLNTLTVESGTQTLDFGADALNLAPIETLNIGRNWTYSKNEAISTHIKSVNISDYVTKIPDYAFYKCSGLTSVEFPNSVTSVGKHAFDRCSDITSIIIPPGVTSIGDEAFSNCFSLKKSAYPDNLDNPFHYGISVPYPAKNAITENGWIYNSEKSAIYFAPFTLEGEYTVDKTVKSIGTKAFMACSGLTSVNSLAEIPPKMAGDSFGGLYATATLTLPETAVEDYLVTSWAQFENIISGASGSKISTYSDGVLNYRLIPSTKEGEDNIAIIVPGNYTHLTDVTIPWRFTAESENAQPTRYIVDGIGYNAFNGCRWLNSVSFHNRNAIKLIGGYAFARSSLKQITIPETVETIGEHAFEGTSIEQITIPEKVTDIGDYAFSSSALRYVIIPENVKSIGEGAFLYTYMTGIDLQEGLESIGAQAFASPGRAFEGVTFPLYIPSTVKTIGADAFDRFYCYPVQISDLTAWCNIEFGNEKANPLNHAKDLYLNNKKVTDLIIPETVKEIKPYAFYGTEFESVTIPGNVTKIGKLAFSSSTKNVIFENGVTPLKIAYSAFNKIENLLCNRNMEDMYLPTVALTNLTIGNDVSEIPSSKFTGAINLKSITLGSGITTIGDQAFSTCPNIREVILPPSVGTIGASAFAGNHNLVTIIMGHNVKSIGDKAFDGCPASTVSITAQMPPKAPNNTFSNYNGKLYLQGPKAVDAYLDAYTCWDRFNSRTMIEPERLYIDDSPKSITGKSGDTFQLTAKLLPENVTLPYIFWRSTNPDIAYVDNNGLVTLRADTRLLSNDDLPTCKIIAESLYANGPINEVIVGEEADVDEIFINGDNSENIDFSAPLKVFNLQGVFVADSTVGLSPGFYIVRQGKNVKKIAIR